MPFVVASPDVRDEKASQSRNNGDNTGRTFGASDEKDASNDGMIERRYNFSVCSICLVDGGRPPELREECLFSDCSNTVLYPKKL